MMNLLKGRHFNSGSWVALYATFSFILLITMAIITKATSNYLYFYIGIGFFSPFLIFAILFISIAIGAIFVGLFDYAFPRKNKGEK